MQAEFFYVLQKMLAQTSTEISPPKPKNPGYVPAKRFPTSYIGHAAVQMIVYHAV